MSEHGFHVHGPHDHELEHAQQGGHGSDHGKHGGMINQIALFTAIIATVGAIFGYMGGATQAKSTKQSLAELARDLASDDKKATYQIKIDRYEKEKNDIKVVADKLELDATQWDRQSEQQMHQHHRWAQSTTVLQVAIGMIVGALATLHI